MWSSLSTGVAIFALGIAAETPTRTWELPAGAKSLEVNGYEMAYVERGTGESVLLVHGTLSDFRAFSGVMDPLAAKHRVIAVSLRHYYPERWDGTGGNFSLRQHINDVVAFIRTLNAGRVHLVGHSRGGSLALYIASEHGELLRTVTVAEAGFAMPAFDVDSAQTSALFVNTLAMLEQGKIDEGLAHLIDYVGGPGSWKDTPEIRRPECA